MTQSRKVGMAGVSGTALTRAMTVSTVAGALGTMWVHVCSPQPIFNVFLINHMGASSATLGLLVSLMQASAVLQLLSVFIYARTPRRKPFWIVLHVIHRLAGFVVMIAAFSVAKGASRQSATLWIVAAVAASWGAMNVSSSGWLSWMADLVPERVRGSFFLRRSAVAQAVTVIWFFVVTLSLDLAPESSTSTVYGIAIGIGAVAGVADILMHLAIPEPHASRGGAADHSAAKTPIPVASVPDRQDSGLDATLRQPGDVQARRVPRGTELSDFLQPLRDGNFVRYSLSVGTAVFAINLVGPFLSPYVTSPDGLGAPNIWLGIMTVISQLVWVAIAPFWGVVMDRYGRKPAVILGCLTVAGWIGYFFMTPLNYIFILPVVALIGGFFGPAFWEGSGQLMLSLAPSANRVSYIAWYNTLVGLVSSLAPLLGGAARDTLADFEFSFLGLDFGGFHIVLSAALVLIAVAMLLIDRTGEGRQKTFADVATELAGGTLFRSFVSLDALNRVQDEGRIALALRKIEDGSGGLLLEEIIGRLEDPSPAVRSEAARALGRIKAPEAVVPLCAALLQPAGTIRIEAARALGSIGDRRALPALDAAMRSPWPELRSVCAEALGSMGQEESTQILLWALRTEREASVILMGAEAASRAGRGEGESEVRFEIFDAVRKLFPECICAQDPVIRRQYAIALANLLGKPGEFYQYLTGAHVEQAARLRDLLRRFEGSIQAFLAPGRVHIESKPRFPTRPDMDFASPDGLGFASIPGKTAGEGTAARDSEQRRAAVQATVARLTGAVGSAAWEEALHELLILGDAVLDRLVGPLLPQKSADYEIVPGESGTSYEVSADSIVVDATFRELAHLDIRLATWWWISEETRRMSIHLDDEARHTLLVLGMYFLERT